MTSPAVHQFLVNSLGEVVRLVFESPVSLLDFGSFCWLYNLSQLVCSMIGYEVFIKSWLWCWKRTFAGCPQSSTGARYYLCIWPFSLINY